MRFADIPGHDDVKNRLREMVDNDRLPHALVLEGIPGIHKWSLARATAAYIHCTDRQGGDSCGKCDACRQHASFNHIDTFYSFPVVKINSKPTTSDDWAPEFRDFMTEEPLMDTSHWLARLGNANAQPQIYVEEASRLIERLNLKARNSRYKVVLMWLPERLHTSAANKLLKLIEEPYPDTLFIMSSDNPAAILPTIYSRTQRIAVRRYTDSEVAAILTAQGVDAQAAAAAAQLAEGQLTAALNAAGKGTDRHAFFDLFTALMRGAWQKKVRDLREWSLKVANLGREGAMAFYSYCAEMIRDNFVLNLGNDSLVSLSGDEMTFSRRFSPYINERNVEGFLALMDSAREDTAANGNQKIIAFDLAVSAIILLRK